MQNTKEIRKREKWRQLIVSKKGFNDKKTIKKDIWLPTYFLMVKYEKYKRESEFNI